MRRREFVGYSALALAAAGAVAYRLMRSGGESRGFAPAPSASDQSGTSTLPPREVELLTSIGQKVALDPADVDVLLRFISNTESDESLIFARTAVAFGADRLQNARVAPDDRARLESALVGTLSHPLWRMRLSGLAALASYPLRDRPDVIEKMRSLQNDPNPEVAKRARAIAGEK